MKPKLTLKDFDFRIYKVVSYSVATVNEDGFQVVFFITKEMAPKLTQFIPGVILGDNEQELWEAYGGERGYSTQEEALDMINEFMTKNGLVTMPNLQS